VHEFALSEIRSITDLKAEVLRSMGLDSGEINIKYLDYEGDLVTIGCDEELHEAQRLAHEFCGGDLSLVLDVRRPVVRPPVPVTVSKTVVNDVHLEV